MPTTVGSQQRTKQLRLLPSGSLHSPRERQTINTIISEIYGMLGGDNYSGGKKEVKEDQENWKSN